MVLIRSHCAALTCVLVFCCCCCCSLFLFLSCFTSNIQFNCSCYSCYSIQLFMLLKIRHEKLEMLHFKIHIPIEHLTWLNDFVPTLPLFQFEFHLALSVRLFFRIFSFPSLLLALLSLTVGDFESEESTQKPKKKKKNLLNLTSPGGNLTHSKSSSGVRKRAF